MYSKRAITVFLTFLLALGISVLFAPLGFSQGAFLPFKGEGNYYFGFQNFYTKEHFNQDGTRGDYGHIQVNALMHGVEYGLTPKLAIDASFPYVFGKYNGDSPQSINAPHRSPGNTTDNGTYHGTVADFRFGARYNLEMRPFAITPFIEGIVPSHNYEQYSHSAVGYGLRELRFGVSAGRFFPSWRSVVQAQYSYGIVQSHFGIRPNRSTVKSQFQYFVTRRLFLTGFQGFQKSHGGVDFPSGFSCVEPWTCETEKDGVVTQVDEMWYRHGQISNFSFLHFGVAAGYALNRSGSLEIIGNYMTDVWGRSGHVLNRGLGITLSINFRTRDYDEKKSEAAQNNCGVVCRKCQTIFRLPIKRTPTPGR